MESITWATRRLVCVVWTCIRKITFPVNLGKGYRVTGWVIISFLFFLAVNTAIGQKTLLMEDKIYEPQIRTVMCYSLTPGAPLPSTAVKIDAQNLILEFDDLQEDRNNYYARIIHCNYDWSKSLMRDLDILRDYNEFPINDFGFSINTHIPYVHYRFLVPPVKMPGNYLLIVYRDGNKNDIVLSRRFMVYQNLVILAQDDNLIGLGNLKSTNQALNFKLSYARMEVINPTTQIHVTLRQNHRWDNARFNLQPSFIREDIKQLEYRFFDMNNTFSAGNEFRFVDFRSMNSPGYNTKSIDRAQRPFELYVTDDTPRGSQAYTQFPDKNGAYVIENLDTRQEPWISNQYLYVNFMLRSPELENDVYVIGGFNTWERTEENRMIYNNGAYACRLLLKQGFYDYQYWVTPSANTNSNVIEGNYFQTENLYEVLVYHRPYQPNADILVGYFLIPVNPR